MPSLVHFLKTGELGPVRTGMTTDEVERAFGPPHDVSVSKRPSIWKYAIIEFTFHEASRDENPVVASITINFHSLESSSFSRYFKFSDWVPSACTPTDEFRAYLENHSIGIVGGVTTGPDQSLVLKSGVRATFQEGTLYSVSYAPKGESKIKQVTCTVPTDDFESIRREAKELGVSVSVLCSRWIRERVLSLQAHS